ncbi:hypothetical protein [Desulfovirgula thermocuniculi]|uniref:hypothetical protein n=1 Tax=Desulfovirgula thermocuniculi TaxID=348842 RepID=UPI000401A6A5|nr:hypothetical protein [Desulfovirgula thermocuniculi]
MAVLEVKDFSVVDIVARMVMVFSWLTAVGIVVRPSIPGLKKVCAMAFLLTLAEMAFLFVVAVVIAALRAIGVAVFIEGVAPSRPPATAYTLMVFTLFCGLLVANAIVLVVACGLCRWAEEESESEGDFEGYAKTVV